MSRPARVWGWLLTLLAAAATVAWQLGAAQPRQVREIAQERWTYATPPLAPDHEVGQTFTVRGNGLTAIEVLAARYRPERPLPADARVTLVLERLDRPGHAPLAVTLSLAGVQNNQRLRFAFAALPDSAGASYRFSLRAPEDYGLGVWASQEEAWADGQMLVNGAVSEGDLLFYTYRAYTFREWLRDLPGILGPWGSTLVAAGVALALPGLALLAWAPPRRRLDPATAAACLLAMGLCLWPLLLLWTTTLGMRVTAQGAWALLAGLAFTALAGFLRSRASGRSLRLAPFGLPDMALLVVLAVAVGQRMVQARAQIVPVWVDGVHHTMVTQLIAEQGFVPRTGEPFLRLNGFHYHFGFHAVAAVLSWLTGLPAYRSVLGLGQLLSGLAGLPVYALTAHLVAPRGGRPPLRARWAGVLAAAVPSFVAYLPAYYLSWARYTQLAGLLILPVLLARTLDLITARTQRSTPSMRGLKWPVARNTDREWAWAVLLVGGLALTHYRVLAFYIAFWGVCLAVTVAQSACKRTAPTLPRPARFWGPLRVALLGAGLAAGALLLIAPWVVRMLTAALLPFRDIYGQWAAPEGVETRVPLGLLRVEGTPWLLAASGVGWLWAAFRRHWRLVLLGAWAVACLLLSDPSWLGARGTWFVHGTSAAISFWLPVGVLTGWLVADILHAPLLLLRAGLARWRGAMALSAGFLASLTVAALASCWPRVDRVNEATVLLRESDLPAIAWVSEHLPADSLILINTRLWQGDIHMGSDAGWWLPYLTGHQVSYPAVLYVHGDAGYREPITELARAVETAPSLDDPALVRRLAEAGITHVFVGTRGGPLQPERLSLPHYVELFRHGPTRVYRFVPPES